MVLGQWSPIIPIGKSACKRSRSNENFITAVSSRIVLT
jgi:hypothetical protein